MKKATEFFAGNGMKKLPTRRIHQTWHHATSTFLVTSKACSQVHHSRNPINFYRGLIRVFSPLKKHIGTRVSGVDGQIGATLCDSWWFSRRYVKKSEGYPSFT
jgi:hypothetical protein